MRLMNIKCMLIPFEPFHVEHIYKWYHSGEYEDFFLNIEPIDMQTAAIYGKNCMMIVNPSNTGEIYGMICVFNLKERHRSASFGCLVLKPYQRKGVGYEATKMAMYYILNNMNMYLVEGEPLERNKNSIGMLKKVGFEFDGVNGVKKHRVYLNGEFHNTVSMHITKGIFNKRFKQEMDRLC